MKPLTAEKLEQLRQLLRPIFDEVLAEPAPERIRETHRKLQ